MSQLVVACVVVVCARFDGGRKLLVLRRPRKPRNYHFPLHIPLVCLGVIQELWIPEPLLSQNLSQPLGVDGMGVNAKAGAGAGAF